MLDCRSLSEGRTIMISSIPSLDTINKVQYIYDCEAFSRALPVEISISPSYEKINAHHVVQVHGDQIVETSDQTDVNSSSRPEADGLVSQAAGEAIAIKTADCLPVLFWSKHLCAALHAGWRGLTNGIIDNFLQTYKHENDLKALLGPCISPSNFEVGPEVISSFINGSPYLNHEQIASCVTKGFQDKWYLDMKSVTIHKLIHRGIPPQNIFSMPICTYANCEWPSYRRQGKSSHRILSQITLKK